MSLTIKRVFDIVAAASLLVLLVPVLSVIAFLIWVKMGRPVLFRQQRPGQNGKPFVLLKFRTMLSDLDESGQPLPDHERITQLGRFLRSTSLDEVPELINVLRGEMSLVGPRPLLMEYLSEYTDEQHRRHKVRPGITGLAQVSGRNLLDWEERFRLDVWYVDNRSFLLDLWIILATLRTVVSRRGVSAIGEATMYRFQRSNLSDSDV